MLMKSEWPEPSTVLCLEATVSRLHLGLFALQLTLPEKPGWCRCRQRLPGGVLHRRVEQQWPVAVCLQAVVTSCKPQFFTVQLATSSLVL